MLRAIKDRLGLLEPPAFLGIQARRGHKDIRGLSDIKDPRDIEGLVDIREVKALRDRSAA